MSKVIEEKFKLSKEELKQLHDLMEMPEEYVETVLEAYTEKKKIIREFKDDVITAIFGRLGVEVIWDEGEKTDFWSKRILEPAGWIWLYMKSRHEEDEEDDSDKKIDIDVDIDVDEAEEE